MISSNDFDHFLKNGYIEGLASGTSMHKLLQEFGEDYWYVKETEVNGLIYGIIKVGFIEFHIYNEKINGISYRPDILFSKEDFKDKDMPWIYEKRRLEDIENELTKRNIGFKTYTVFGPLDGFVTAGIEFFALEECEHTFIDTEGGVTFIFEENPQNGQLEAYQIARYYDVHKQESTGSA